MRTVAIYLVPKLELLWAAAYYYMAEYEPTEFERVFGKVRVQFDLPELEDPTLLANQYLELRANIRPLGLSQSAQGEHVISQGEGAQRLPSEEGVQIIAREDYGATIFYGIKVEKDLEDLTLPDLLNGDRPSLELQPLVKWMQQARIGTPPGRNEEGTEVLISFAGTPEARKRVANALARVLGGVVRSTAWPSTMPSETKYRRLASEVYGARTLLARKAGYFAQEAAEIRRAVWQDRAVKYQGPPPFAKLKEMAEARESSRSTELLLAQIEAARTHLTATRVVAKDDVYKDLWRFLDQTTVEPMGKKPAARFLPPTPYKRVDAFYGVVDGIMQRLPRGQEEIRWHFGAALVDLSVHPEFSDFYQPMQGTALVLFSGGTPIKTIAADRAVLPFLLGVNERLEPVAQPGNVFSIQNVLHYLNSAEGADTKAKVEALLEISAFTGRYSFLNNFSEHPVVYEGVEYPTAEHAFQAAKFMDPGLREQIRQKKTPKEAATLGRSRTLPLRSDWEKVKRFVMKEILGEKFQDPALRQKLLSTGDAELVHGNKHGDTYWGKVAGQGENVLGEILMELREEAARS